MSSESKAARNTGSDIEKNEILEEDFFASFEEPQCRQGHVLCPLNLNTSWCCEVCALLGKSKPYDCERCNYNLCGLCYSKAVREGVGKRTILEKKDSSEDEEKICEEIRKVPSYLKKYFGETNINFEPDVESIDEWTGNIRPSDANIFSCLKTE